MGIPGRTGDLPSTFQNERMGGAFVNTDPAAQATVGPEHGDFSLLIVCFRGILQPERLHGTTLHTETARLTCLGTGFHPVVGNIMALGVR